MEQPTYKKYAIVGAVVVVVVGAIAITLLQGNEEASSVSTQKSTPGKPKGQDVFRPENEKALTTIEGGTREVISKKVATLSMEASTSSVPTDVAVPISVSKLGLVSKRTFEITGKDKILSPSTIVVDDGDVITIILKATDGDYSFSISDFGVSGKAASGSETKIYFQATAFGQYKITCGECKTGFSGTLIANKKQ